MPLSMVQVGSHCIVQRISGKSDLKTHLEGLGLVPGCEVVAVAKNAGGVILNVRESRVALAHDMARKVLV